MEKYVYVLRTNDSEGKGYGGFQWPKKGKVEAPDWNPEPICGGGLHGLLNGEGNADLLNWGADAQWQVVKVLATDIVHIGTGKVKFPRGVVVYTGDRSGATSFLHAKIGNGFSIHGVATTAGDYGTATAGDYGTATAGDYGTATAGDYGTATAGYKGTATAGRKGTATAGNYGTATAGRKGTATAGNYGTATAGDEGTATAGHKGTATAGHKGTATAGDEGTATAGNNGIIECRWWYYDNGTNTCKKRVATFYEGEDFKANVKYRFECTGKVCKIVEVAE
jgi:hypothetical protein